MSQKKVLIIGAQGNLGIQLTEIFGKGYQIISWDKNDIDLTGPTSDLEKKIIDTQSQIIINAAAYNAVDKCEEDREFVIAQKINGESVGAMAKAALISGALLVHYSTDYVFPGNLRKGYHEDDEQKPINKYGESKLMGEKEILQKYNQGLKFYLIRTSKLFGPKGKSPESKPNFFDIMLAQSEKTAELNVVSEEMSCFTYTVDLAQETRKLIENNYQSGIYHLVNQGAVTWYEAAIELFKIVDIYVKINPVASSVFTRAAKRPQYSVLLNNKTKPLRSWQTALKEYLHR